MKSIIQTFWDIEQNVNTLTHQSNRHEPGLFQNGELGHFHSETNQAHKSFLRLFKIINLFSGLRLKAFFHPRKIIDNCILNFIQKFHFLKISHNKKLYIYCTICMSKTLAGSPGPGEGEAGFAVLFSI